MPSTSAGILIASLTTHASATSGPFLRCLRRREENAISDIRRDLPQIDRMRLLDVNHVERGAVAMLCVDAIQFGNSRTERRSRVTAEDEDDGLPRTLRTM